MNAEVDLKVQLAAKDKDGNGDGNDKKHGGAQFPVVGEEKRTDARYAVDTGNDIGDHRGNKRAHFCGVISCTANERFWRIFLIKCHRHPEQPGHQTLADIPSNPGGTEAVNPVHYHGDDIPENACSNEQKYDVRAEIAGIELLHIGRNEQGNLGSCQSNYRCQNNQQIWQSCLPQELEHIPPQFSGGDAVLRFDFHRLSPFHLLICLLTHAS